VAKKYKTLAAVRAATVNELLLMDGIGDISAGYICSGLLALSDTIDELTGYVNIQEVEEKTGSLVGTSFCITGKISMGKKAAHAMIEGVGGEAWTSVKNGLTYLVTDDPTSTSGKMKKAVKLGVKVIDEAKMVELVNG